MLTVFDWTPDVIADWLAHGQPYMDDGIDLFPSERGVLVSEDALLRWPASSLCWPPRSTTLHRQP